MNKSSYKNLKLYSGMLSLLILISSCSQQKSEKKNQAAKGQEIKTLVLESRLLSSELKMPGELIANQQVDLYAKVSSFVKNLKADVGSQVTAGQLLMTLEAPEMSSQLAAAESRLKAQEAVFTASKASYDRLYATSQTPGTISTNDLEQAQAKMNADLAQLHAAKASFKEIGTIQNYLEIRAPFSGIISSRNVNAGAYVGPSGKGSEFPLFTLQEQKHLRLVVSIPEQYTGYLKSGDTITFKVKSQPAALFTATVKRMSGALDQRLRSERVEMDVPNLNKKLLPGMIADVSIPLPANASTFVVPKTAIVDGSEGIYVIRSKNNRAEKINVKKGRETEDKIEIFGNLNKGDKLVAVASEEIHDGDLIKL